VKRFAFAAVVALALILHSCDLQRYVIPDGYFGWVVVFHDVASCPPVPRLRGWKTYRFAPDGTLCTSDPIVGGWMKSEYLYANGKALVDDRDIWQKSTGEATKDGVRHVFVDFFVGSRRQFDTMPRNNRIAPGVTLP